MWRMVRRFVAAFVATLSVAVALAFALPASPLYMPSTLCRPDPARYATAPMGASYQVVAHHMGCDGVKATEEDLGNVVRIITYVWRTESWPVGIVRLKFYNDTLQAKSETSLNLWLHRTAR